MTMDPRESPRYARQISLRNFGSAGQAKLRASSVLVVGAGGLGCAALPYLAAAGVGRIGIVDDDVIALENLHRQTLYATSDVGAEKAETAAHRLRALNPEIAVRAYPERLGEANAAALVADHDLVLDASDNPATRYLLDDVCAALDKPLVFGAISDYEGQVAVFRRTDGEDARTRYRDFFPAAARAGEIRDCAETGVLGVLPGIVGAMQAAEALKLLSGCGPVLEPGILAYSALTHRTHFFARPHASPSVAAKRTIGTETITAISPSRVREISATELADLLDRPEVVLFDVREDGERPAFSAPHTKFPLSRIPAERPRFGDGAHVVLVCKSGARSRRAGDLLAAEAHPDTKFYSLRGGVLAWEGTRE